MELKEYLNFKRIEIKEFAAMIGCSDSAMYNYVSGRRPISLPIAIKIRKALNNRVSYEEINAPWERENAR